MKEYNLTMQVFVGDMERSSVVEHLAIIGDTGLVIGEEMLSALREAFDAGLTVHLRAGSGEKP